MTTTEGFWTGDEVVPAGVGVDVVEVERIARAAARHPRFAARILSEAELRRFGSFRGQERRTSFLAGRFAAKEAVMKALGQGMGRVRWRDVAVINGPTGKPEAFLADTALRAAGRLGVTKVLVSVSHSRQTAVAVAVALSEGGTGRSEAERT